MNEIKLRKLIRKQLNTLRINEVMDQDGPRVGTWQQGWRNGWSDALDAISSNLDYVDDCPTDLKRLLQKLRKDGQLSRR
jgi:hypothetical protein